VKVPDQVMEAFKSAFSMLNWRGEMFEVDDRGWVIKLAGWTVDGQQCLATEYWVSDLWMLDADVIDSFLSNWIADAKEEYQQHH